MGLNLTSRRQAMKEYFVDNLEKLLLNTLVTFRDNETTNMPTPYMFQNKTALESIYLPNAVGAIPEYAFDGCTSLEDFDLHGATSVGGYAFRNCSSLTEVNLPNVTGGIPNYAFDGCTSLTEVDLHGATSIGQYAFRNCSDLQYANLPGVTSIGRNAFQNCSSLREIVIPNTLSSIALHAFDNCSGLLSIELPNVTGGIPDYAFYNCNSLRTVKLPKITSVGFNGFYHCSSLGPIVVFQQVYNLPQNSLNGASSMTTLDCGGNGSGQVNQWSLSGCSKLTTLLLRSSTMLPLSTVNTLGDTPFASSGSGGTLYVPNDLISSYQSASNWSTILGYANNQILPIEGSQYEHYYADDTPIPQEVTSDEN